MFVTLFTTPNATSTLTEVSNYSSALFDSLVPLAWIAVGFIVGGLLVSFLIGAVLRGVRKVTGGGRAGMRRGGRRR